MYLKERGCEAVERICVIQDLSLVCLVSGVINIQSPFKVCEFLHCFCDYRRRKMDFFSFSLLYVVS
jgi:hypothetical protein